MKKLFRYLVVMAFLMLPLISTQVMASDPPPPPDPGSQGDIDPEGGGASIGGGLLVMLSLSAGYGLKKLYDSRRKLDE